MNITLSGVTFDAKKDETITIPNAWGNTLIIDSNEYEVKMEKISTSKNDTLATYKIIKAEEK